MDSYEKEGVVKNIKHEDENTNLDSSSMEIVNIKQEEFIECGGVLEGDSQEAEGSHSCLKSSVEKVEIVKEEIFEHSPLDVPDIKQPIKKFASYDPVHYTKDPLCSGRQMQDDILRQIAAALVGNEHQEHDNSETTTFCIEGTISCKDIDISVEGVGKLQFPLDKSSIQKLIAISADAKFGLGEKTLVDKNFRNTQMIESKYLDVNFSQNALGSVINDMHTALNLPENSYLKPHLHNMLIYTPGQFFGEHRDSEKMENMVATLVVVLPSPHIGGTLLIKHINKKFKFATENLEESDARCICFFSDCWHQVKEVTHGHRMVLTYNIVLENGQLLDLLQNDYLEGRLSAYFDDSEEEIDAKKLVILLNHSYSEHSLKWNLLKGEDIQYARLLCSAAKKLKLAIHLVLVEINHQWSSEEYVVELIEFLESSENIEYWIDEHNKKLPYGKYSVESNEICFTKETHNSHFKPFKRDFSGPTGNEGATVDYWYKRAAIVLWQQSDSMKAQFELNHEMSLNTLHALTKVSGNETKVEEILQQVGKLVKGGSHLKLFPQLAEIALYIKDEERAKSLLTEFDGRVITADNSGLILRLQKQYGIPWLNGLFGALTKKQCVDKKQIFNFMNHFLGLGGERSILQTLLDAAVIQFTTKIYYYRSNYLSNVHELFKACNFMDNVQIQEKLIQHLLSKPETFSRDDVVKLYFELNKLPELCGKLDIFHKQLIETIGHDIQKSPPDNDWSIPQPKKQEN
ncbi:hypothetical protein JTB14_009294 [Gonioctena quinquepunctata]|nr:hypothetical protein JTB14_009294 [Gonioctena quinquepunctata]